MVTFWKYRYLTEYFQLLFTKLCSGGVGSGFGGGGADGGANGCGVGGVGGEGGDVVGGGGGDINVGGGGAVWQKYAYGHESPGWISI